MSSFSRVGIAPRVRVSTTRGAMPTRLNNLGNSEDRKSKMETVSNG
ncbi:hypothetical protein LF1_01950 [Rubripirellula obstinata]|uniref:Uncharacterized protein n=1 Tax=Rubripirellula obstinata TaxID=406547 RepID=A0A5B1C9A6_9BACT|nr:hypothetical protein LF1_01950 [Rubripirellula obstinata]